MIQANRGFEHFRAKAGHRRGAFLWWWSVLVLLQLVPSFVLGQDQNKLLYSNQQFTSGAPSSWSPFIKEAGDIDADGIEDFLVCSAGTIRVFSGINGAVIHTLSMPLDLPDYSACGVGDLNGDGYDDFALRSAQGLSIRSGMNAAVIRTINISWVLTDVRVAKAGDINGDGYTDILVFGSPLSGTSQASVYVYSGANGNLIQTFKDPNTAQWLGRFGIAACGVGDVNLDGFDDILVGAPGLVISVRGGYPSFAYVYSGFDGTVIHTLSIPAANAGNDFGSSVAATGDVNKDGYPDFVVGAPTANLPTFTSTGVVTVFSGLDASVIYSKTAPITNQFLGGTVSGGGDVNGDGYPDFIATNRSASVFESTCVYSGIDGSLMTTFTNAQSTIKSGAGAVIIGDSNNDGRAEVAMIGYYDRRIDVNAYVVSVPYVGANADFRMLTGINQLPIADWSTKSVTGSDYVIVKMESLAGSYLNAVPVLLAQLFITGTSLQSPAGYPEVHLDPSPFAQYAPIVLYDAQTVTGPYPPGTGLPVGGLYIAGPIPPGLTGFSLMMQAFALAPSPTNPYFVASHAQELVIQ